MANKLKTPPTTRKTRPALTPEAREKQLIALAIDAAEQQLLDGSASPSVITHFLKLASSKEKLEKELLEKQVELAAAKTEAIKSAERIEELYSEALKAMRQYQYVAPGQDDGED